MSEKKEKQKQKQLNIAIDENIADGVYSNLAIINHSTSEFIVDFVNIMPGSPKAKVKSRMIMAPSNAKSLVMILQDNIKKYEDKFGEIKINKGKNILLINFQDGVGNKGVYRATLYY